ncbi:MAG: hypothetical protein IJA54_00880 [Tyzzerella sp.]|nr:hypothetical protein [Tyzzerella sp.]
MQYNENLGDKKIVCAARMAVLCTFIICFILSFLPEQRNNEWILNTFVHPLENFVPETSEKLQYVLGTVTFVLTYFVTSLFLKTEKIKLRGNINLIRDFLIWGFIIMSGLLLVKEKLFLENVPSILLKVGLVSFVGMLILSVANMRISFKGKTTFINMVLLLGGLLSIIIVSSFYMRETYFYGSPNVEHHTNAYFYPIWKVWCGQYPLVDFASLYGYYPYFFVGIMALFGGVTIKKFGVIIAILMAVIFLAMFYVLWVTCKNKIWAFSGLMSIECLLCMYNAELTGEYYLQYYPHRMITLCVILAICCMYIRYKQKHGRYSKRIEILGWICSGIALLWNLDTGLVVWLGWTIYLCFLHLLSNRLFTKNTWIYIGKTVLKCIITVTISFILLLILTYVLSGERVEFKELFFGQSIFYSSGFYMLKMSLLHPWLIVISIYGLGIVISVSYIKDIIDKEKRYDVIKIAMYFMMAVVGVGAFLYYQGRSHNYVFVAIVWPAILLIALLLDDLSLSRNGMARYGLITKSVYHSCYSILAALLITFSIGWFYYVLSPNYLKAQKHKEYIGFSVVQADIDALKTSGLQPQNVDMLTEYAAEVYENLEIRYMPNIQAEVDIFTWQHVKDIQEYLESTKKDVIIDEKMKNYFIANDEVGFNAILESKYELEEYNGYLICKHKEEGNKNE